MPLALLHVSTETGWRGGEAQTLHLARGLQSRGHRNRIVAPPGSPLLERAAVAGLETTALRALGEWDLLAARRLAGLVRSLPADLVHCHTAHAVGLGSLATLFGVHPGVVASRRVSFGLRHATLGRWKYSWRVDRVIAVSEAIRRQLIGQGLAEDCVVTVHSGIDPARFAGGDRERARQALARDTGWPADAWIVGTAGHLAAHKGIDLFLAAAALVGAQRPQARFLVIGQGERRETLAAQVTRLGLDDRVCFLGFRDDMPDLYAALDLFVLASHSGEGFPAVLKEAMAAGIPVVATALDGVGEIIEDARHGLLTPPGDAAALARAVVTLSGDAALRARLVAAARQRVQAFTLERMVQRTEAVYASIGAAR